MAFVLKWVPKNMTDSLMRAIIKNEATGRKIKEAIVKKMQEDGNSDFDAENAVVIDANPDFIRVIIDKSGSGASALNEIDLDDLIPQYDAEEFLFGKDKKIDDADESPEDFGKEIKDIIEGVITDVAPLESIE